MIRGKLRGINRDEYGYNYFGMIEKSKLKSYALESIVEFLDGRLGIDNAKTPQDIENYLSYGYYEECECYMDNPCWDISAVIDGQWHNISMTYEEIFNAILIERNKKEKEEENVNDD